MARRILTVAQQKGGAGKTTLVAHLAVALARSGERVVALDIDPQGSLAAWGRAREAAVGDGGRLEIRALAGWRTAGEVDRAAREADVVLIDSPPHAETEARIAVRAADLVVVPLQPSPMDLWATRVTLDLAAQEKRPAVLVLNRLPARGRLADAVGAEARKLGVRLARATIGNRVALAHSMMEGLGVAEAAPRSPAAQEIAALAAELIRMKL